MSTFTISRRVLIGCILAVFRNLSATYSAPPPSCSIPAVIYMCMCICVHLNPARGQVQVCMYIRALCACVRLTKSSTDRNTRSHTHTKSSTRASIGMHAQYAPMGCARCHVEALAPSLRGGAVQPDESIYRPFPSRLMHQEMYLHCVFKWGELEHSPSESLE